MIEPVLSESLRNELKELVREVIHEELAGKGSDHPIERNGDDGLVNVDKAAEYLSMSKSWLYKNSNRLPFAKKVVSTDVGCADGSKANGVDITM